MKFKGLLALLLALTMLLCACAPLSDPNTDPEDVYEEPDNTEGEPGENTGVPDLDDPAYIVPVPEGIPEYTGAAYVHVAGGHRFTEEEITTEAYEFYSPLDSLGRCGYAMACLGRELMPTEPRENISHIKPTGWIQAKYDCIKTKDLYNRSHLIGFQLSGENANRQNLITGTPQLNQETMESFESEIADYIKETNNHVMYRVTPYFEGDNLLCGGVSIEAYSVEDEGDGIDFHIFIYNAQKGVAINYKTGESFALSDGNTEDTTGAGSDGETEKPEDTETDEYTYILNTNSKKIHKPDCDSVDQMLDTNKQGTNKTVEELKAAGYSSCGNCKP